MTNQQTTSRNNTVAEGGASFWDHLDELRHCLLRILAVVLVLSVVAFCLKDWLFALMLAPARADFVTYRLMGLATDTVRLVNTELARQLSVHISAAFGAALVVGSPWVFKELFGFVSPGLYAHERHYALRLLLGAYVMFALGAVVSYLLIFPMTVHFLGGYQVSADVSNLITLDSYVNSLLTTTLFIGLLFELPVVCWLLGRFGLIDRPMMRRYRRHAIVAIMVLSAIITPADVVSLCIVALPIVLLYEASILLVPRARAD